MGPANRAHLDRLAPLVAVLRGRRLSYSAIADRLNAEGHRTVTGRAWTYGSALAAFKAYAPDTKTRGRRPGTEPAAPVRARIYDKAVNRMIHRLAARAGIGSTVRPHGLRHQAITRALDLTGGDIRRVARFARHSNPKTTLAYDDSRQDLAGAVARLLGDD